MRLQAPTRSHQLLARLNIPASAPDMLPFAGLGQSHPLVELFGILLQHHRIRTLGDLCTGENARGRAGLQRSGCAPCRDALADTLHSWQLPGADGVTIHCAVICRRHRQR